MACKCLGPPPHPKHLALELSLASPAPGSPLDQGRKVRGSKQMRPSEDTFPSSPGSPQRHKPEASTWGRLTGWTPPKGVTGTLSLTALKIPSFCPTLRNYACDLTQCLPNTAPHGDLWALVKHPSSRALPGQAEAPTLEEGWASVCLASSRDSRRRQRRNPEASGEAFWAPEFNGRESNRKREGGCQGTNRQTQSYGSLHLWTFSLFASDALPAFSRGLGGNRSLPHSGITAHPRGQVACLGPFF